MTSTKLFLLATLMIAGYALNAQVTINTDGSSADASSMLDVKSTDKGMLIPRMIRTEIMAIASPANGLIVFNTTDDKFYAFVLADNEWKEMAYGTGIITLPAVFSIGTGGACNNTVVNGTYQLGVALSVSEYVTIDVNVTTLGVYTITTDTINGYIFSKSGTFTLTGTQNIDLAGSGTPVVAQTDNFTATASNNGGTCTFIVSPPTCGTPITDSRDGQSYNTVQIGTQCWMAENLNIGTKINDGYDQTDDGTIQKYCYDNLTTNCYTYGGLYQWNEMMQYTTTPGVQGICPSGWHLPTDAEWCTLEQEVDATITCSSTGYRGVDGGGKLKETGTTHWYDPNTGATNSSGFTALPGGDRGFSGSFYNKNTTAQFWSSNESGNYAWKRSLSYTSAQIYRGNQAYKTYGISVRCVQD